jgi:hypothetical protein
VVIKLREVAKQTIRGIKSCVSRGDSSNKRRPGGRSVRGSWFQLRNPSSLLTSTRGESFGSRSIHLTNPFGSADGAARTVEVKVLYEKAGVRVWFPCHCSRGQTTRPQTRSRHRLRIERSRLFGSRRGCATFVPCLRAPWWVPRLLKPKLAASRTASRVGD